MNPEQDRGDLFSVSDDALREAMGRRKEEWFSLLASWGAEGQDHAPTAAWLMAEHSLDPCGGPRP